MHYFNKQKLQVCCASKEVLVLNSFDEFRMWYLQCHDLSMFSEQDIEGLLSEEQPASYPCIPLLSDEGFETFFVATDLVKCWSGSLNLKQSTQLF